MVTRVLPIVWLPPNLAARPDPSHPGETPMAVIYRPPLANPSPGGLYQAATILPGDRLFDGVRVISMNCGPSWIWPIHCEDPVPDPSPKGEDPRAADLDPFEGDVIGTHDNCGLAVPEAEARQRAEQLLRLHEPVRVEQQVTPKLLAAAGAPATPTGGIVGAVAALEEAVAEFGFTGVIHAAPHVAALAHAAQLVTRQGALAVSPSGHRWAFGSGYAGLGETLVLTGPVAIHQGPVIVAEGLDVQHNDRLNTAEREVVVTWECFAEATTIGA